MTITGIVRPHFNQVKEVLNGQCLKIWKEKLIRNWLQLMYVELQKRKGSGKIRSTRTSTTDKLCKY